MAVRVLRWSLSFSLGQQTRHHHRPRRCRRPPPISPISFRYQRGKPERKRARTDQKTDFYMYRSRKQGTFAHVGVEPLTLILWEWTQKPKYQYVHAYGKSQRLQPPKLNNFADTSLLLGTIPMYMLTEASINPLYQTLPRN